MLGFDDVGAVVGVILGGLVGQHRGITEGKEFDEKLGSTDGIKLGNTDKQLLECKLDREEGGEVGFVDGKESGPPDGTATGGLEGVLEGPWVGQEARVSVGEEDG